MVKTIELFPPNLREDKNVQAFAEILDRVFSELTEEDLQKLFVYAIDSQPESVINWLAWQFHVEGYELAQSLEEKRNLVKNAIELHRYKGTRYAIERVLEALNLQGEVKEWFEYDGEPYRFKVDLGIQDREITPELRDKLKKLVEEYKNERSWIEELILGYITNSVFNIATSEQGESKSSAHFDTTFELASESPLNLSLSSCSEQIAKAEIEAFSSSLEELLQLAAFSQAELKAKAPFELSQISVAQLTSALSVSAEIIARSEA
jgi:phage tail P2-like protein